MNPIPTAKWWRAESQTADSDVPSDLVAAAEETESPVAFWALMAFTFILLIAPQTYIQVLAPLRIALSTAVIAVTAYLYDRFIRRQPVTKMTREMWVTTCLVAWAILTVPLSYWPGGSISLLFDLYFKALAIFWLLSHVVTTLPKLRWVAWGLSLMAVPLAATGVRQYLSGDFIPGAAKRIVGYEAPLTWNPNDLALMLNLILPLTVALFLNGRRPMVRIILLTIILLDVSAVILTFSRGGFVTLAAIWAIYLWKLSKRPEWSWAAAALVIALVCIPLMPSGYFDRLSTITDIEFDPTGSAQTRWNDMVTAAKFVVRNPILGAGVGMDVLVLNKERGANWIAVHDVYLQYAVDLGIPGLALFLLLLVACIRSAASVARRSARVPNLQEIFHLALGIQISLVAFSVAALFHPVAYHFYFYYMAGLALTVRAVYERMSGASGWTTDAIRQD